MIAFSCFFRETQIEIFENFRIPEICQAFAAVHLYSLNPHLDLPEEAPQARDMGYCELQTLQKMII